MYLLSSLIMKEESSPYWEMHCWFSLSKTIPLKPCPHLLVGGPIAGPHQQGGTLYSVFSSGNDWAQGSHGLPVRNPFTCFREEEKNRTISTKLP